MSLVIPSVAASVGMGALVPITRFVGINNLEIVSFSNLPQNYRDLYIVVSGVYSGIGGGLIIDSVNVGNVMSQTNIWGVGNNSTVSTQRNNNTGNLLISTSNISQPISSPTPTLSEIFILNYSRSDTFKPALIKHANEKNNPGYTNFYAGSFNSLSPITSFAMSTGVVGSFMSTNMTYSVYGIRRVGE